jgi:hypothetical protein
MGNTHWDSLLRVIAARQCLEEIDLRDDFSEYDRRNPSDRIIPFLLAIQQNPSIQIVGFHSLQLSGDSMASFLDTATSVTELEIRICRLEVTEDALAIAAALQRNRNIQELVLRVLDGVFVIPVLNSLASEQFKLRSLLLTDNLVLPHERESFRAAISKLLQPHSLLCSLELNDFNNLPAYGFETAEEFDLLFTAVATSPLESFSTGILRSRESCVVLITSIPMMQLRTLEILLDSNLRDMKRDMIGAVKGNASLRTMPDWTIRMTGSTMTTEVN